ncbi:hypothetical protein WJX84_006084 [Apatococcus fuscideae]|uniref:YqaJ viral recombinase domain-containing protein n=1 Tax=Apatococcus fuscideae TaxID=2026836 RepID=A0AAW1T1N1_9CHLO
MAGFGVYVSADMPARARLVQQTLHLIASQLNLEPATVLAKAQPPIPGVASVAARLSQPPISSTAADSATSVETGLARPDTEPSPQASAQPQGQPPSETALTPMKAGLAHLVFEPGRSWSMPAEPSRLVMALQQRALTRRPREERPPSRQDDEISLGSDDGVAVRSVEEALELEGAGPLRPLPLSALAAAESPSGSLMALGSSTVRLKGKEANQDTLAFKKDFAVAAAEFAAKSSPGGRKRIQPGAQLSPEWHKLRDSRLTASTFGNALGFWPEGRESLWEEKLGLKEKFKGNAATAWGTRRESSALGRYTELTGRSVESCSFKVLRDDEVHGWLGASPDGLIDGFEANSGGSQIPCGDGPGILEIKCPWNRGNIATARPYEYAPFYYMPQVQGLMDMFDREWCHLYCWTQTGSTIFCIQRDRQYWLRCFEVLAEFWWAHVIPAKHAIALGTETDLDTLRPGADHMATGDLKQASIRMAKKAISMQFTAEQVPCR